MRKILKALLLKKLLVVCLVGAMLVHEQKSYAQALPVANFVINRSIAGVIEKVAIARGFAANDPRIAATLLGVGKVSTGVNVASTVAGVGFAIAGAPVWMGIAASLGVVALGYGINAWVTGSNGQSQQAQIMLATTPTGNNALQVNAPAASLPAYVAPPIADPTPLWAQAVQQGAPIYRSAYNCYSNEACYALPLPPDQGSYRYNADSEGKTLLVTTDVNQFGQWYTFLTKPSFNLPAGVTASWDYAGAQLNPNSAGQFQITVWIHEGRSGGDDQGLPSYDRTNTYNNVGQVYGNIGPANYGSLDQAASALPDQVKNATISLDTVARLVDQAWQRAAAQPDYQGLPYSVAQPVTEGEVIPWANANPGAVPRVGDLLTPASNPGTQTVPISSTVTPGTATDPGTNPGTNPGTSPTPSGDVNVVNTPNVNVTNKVTVDFGADPGINSPELEPTPTADSIFRPIIASVQSLAIYGVPNHPSECPKPRFEIFDKSILMDGHCTLLDSVKPTLFTVMAAVWVVIGVIIVLGA
jgi:hypothetical protein